MDTLYSPPGFAATASNLHPASATARPRVLNADELVALIIAPRQLLLSPWLPEKGLTMLVAERGIGKTWIALNVAVAVATGGSFLGWKAPQARRVLYID